MWEEQIEVRDGLRKAAARLRHDEVDGVEASPALKAASEALSRSSGCCQAEEEDLVRNRIGPQQELPLRAAAGDEIRSSGNDLSWSGHESLQETMKLQRRRGNARARQGREVYPRPDACQGGPRWGPLPSADEAAGRAVILRNARIESAAYPRAIRAGSCGPAEQPRTVAFNTGPHCPR